MERSRLALLRSLSSPFKTSHYPFSVQASKTELVVLVLSPLSTREEISQLFFKLKALGLARKRGTRGGVRGREKHKKNKVQREV